MTKEEARGVLEEILLVLRAQIGRGISQYNFRRYDGALETAARALAKRRRRLVIGRKP